MKTILLTKTFQSLQGFQFLLFSLIPARDLIAFIFGEINSQILGSKYDADSDPL